MVKHDLAIEASKQTNGWFVWIVWIAVELGVTINFIGHRQEKEGKEGQF